MKCIVVIYIVYDSDVLLSGCDQLDKDGFRIYKIPGLHKDENKDTAKVHRLSFLVGSLDLITNFLLRGIAVIESYSCDWVRRCAFGDSTVSCVLATATKREIHACRSGLDQCVADSSYI